MLGISTRSWSRLPEIEGEIDHWDPDDQVDFVVDWPLEEDLLEELEGYRDRGLMAEDQVSRHEELKRLVVRNRPIIERLLES